MAGAAAAQEMRSYEVTVALNWQVVDGKPDDPHWSRLIAVAHSNRYEMFADGDTASSGLALVATNGRVGVLQAELAETRRRDRAGAEVVLPGLPEEAGTFTFTLALTEQHDHVSFATMLAPSPDWFTGLGGVDLHPGEAWLDALTLPLWPWDAGVDSGPDYEGPNLPTQPRESVRLLTHPDFLTSGGLRPIGTVTFQRQP